MADNSVFIAGVADGAFEKSLGALPPWATHKTAVSIEGILRKSLGIQTKMLSEAVKNTMGAGSGNLSPDEVKKVNVELDKLFRNLKRENEEGVKTRKRNKDLEKDDKESLLRGKKLRGADEKLTFVLAGLASVGNKVTDTMMQSFKTTDDLLNSGINLIAGFNGVSDAGVAMQQMVLLTNLRLSTLQKVAEKYTSSINAAGMLKFAKAVSLSSTRLNEMGMSNEQQAELMGSLIESESAYSDIRSRTSEQLANDAVRLGTQLTRLSFTVGLSVEKMAEQMQALSKNTDSTIVSAIYGEKAAKNMNTFIASFGDNKAAAELFQKLAATQTPILTKAYQDIAKAGEGALGDQLTRIAQYARDTGDAVGAQRRAESLALNVSQGTWKALETQASAGNESARATLETLTALRQRATTLSKSTESEIDEAIKNKAARAKVKTQVESAKATPDKMFALLNSQIDVATQGLSAFNSAISKITSTISAETLSWLGIGLAVAGIGSSILVVGKTINTFLSIFGKGTLTIGRAFSGIGSVLGRIGGIFLRFAGPVAAIYAAFQLGTSIGETIYEMLTGVKNSINYFEIITDILKDAGGWISETFISFKNWISGGIDSFITGIKNIGNIVLEFAPWLKTIGGYISSTVGFFKSIFTHVSMFIDSFVGILATLVKGVASKFANKISFGLIGSDTSDFVNDKSSAPPTKISVPKTPMASTIVSPSAVDVQPPKVPDANAPGSAATTIASTAIAKPDSKSDINSMLSFQSNLLDKILLSSNSLVSINSEILRYTRNNA